MPSLRDLITAMRRDHRKTKKLPGPRHNEMEAGIPEHHLMFEVPHHHAARLWEEPNES